MGRRRAKGAGARRAWTTHMMKKRGISLQICLYSTTTFAERAERRLEEAAACEIAILAR